MIISHRTPKTFFQITQLSMKRLLITIMTEPSTCDNVRSVSQACGANQTTLTILSLRLYLAVPSCTIINDGLCHVAAGQHRLITV